MIYYSGEKIKNNEMGEACLDRRDVYRVLLRPQGTRPLGGPRSRWAHNIKMDFE
jgi:hypothetical protein